MKTEDSPATPERIRVLLITHSPILLTGMAEVTRMIFSTLVRDYPGAYELHQVGLSHLSTGHVLPWPVYPTMTRQCPDGRILYAKDDLQGEITSARILAELKPDIVFAFNDPQHLQYLCNEDSQRKHKLILYVNFDGFPVPSCFYNLFNADRILTMSKFAKSVFLASHPNGKAEKVDFMYAPADIERFHPVSEEEKMELRRELLPDWMPANAFVLGWVGLNQWRKQVWVLYHIIHLLRTGRYLLCCGCNRVRLINSCPQDPVERATLRSATYCPSCKDSTFRQAEPLTDIFLWIHMRLSAQRDHWPVEKLENLYNVRSGRDVHYTEGNKPLGDCSPLDMPTMYQVWDALLYLSGGEGFGMPAWEAMSVGIPVIYSNYSSHAEFLGESGGGLPVGGVLQPEPSTCILRLVPSIAEAVEGVRKLYFNPQTRFALVKGSRAFLKHYGNEAQARKWHQVFQDVMED